MAARRPALRSAVRDAVASRASGTAADHWLERLARRLEVRLPRHAGLKGAALLLVASLGFGLVRGDHLGGITEGLRDTRDAIANAVGFNIAHVTLIGTQQLNQDEIFAIAGITGRRSLLFLDAAGVREKLMASPWISDATVLKLYPDRLRIDIKERSAFALWQKDGRVSVIAADGSVLELYLARRFAQLPLVVGEGAGAKARNFLDVLRKYPEINSAVRAVIYVGERRWNLRLVNGIDVRLPETDVEQALARLAGLERDKHLFDKDITAIDLRLSDRVSVRLSDAAAQAREDQSKDKKLRKRAGDA